MRVFIKINQQSTKAHEPHEPRIQGSRHAGNHTNQDTNHTNQGYKVQSMQVTTSNKRQPQGDTNQQNNKFAPDFCVVSKSKQPAKVASSQP